MNIMDWQFLPRGLLDALAYPFYWLVGDNRSSEYPFRDARFAVATVLIVLGIGFIQCLAMIPGVSRSGATILGALSLGVSGAGPVAESTRTIPTASSSPFASTQSAIFKRAAARSLGAVTSAT